MGEARGFPADSMILITSNFENSLFLDSQVFETAKSDNDRTADVSEYLH